MRFHELISKKDLTDKERERLSNLALRLEQTAFDVGSRIGQGGKIRGNLSVGNMRMNPSQAIELFNAQGNPTVRLNNTGNAFFGDNLRNPGDTALSIFSIDTTYNSEDFSEGDVMLGDNSTSKANMLWDKSAGTLKFRGGTTVQAYINTTGAITAGAGNVIINSTGITLDADNTAYFLFDYAGDSIGRIRAKHASTTATMYIRGVGANEGGSIGQVFLEGINYVGDEGCNIMLDSDQGIKLDADGAASTKAVTIEGTVKMKEAASSPAASAAGYGLLWVKNDAPCVLHFTDDAGTDFTVDVSAV